MCMLDVDNCNTNNITQEKAVIIGMGYGGGYPFWEKNRADRAGANAFEARKEANKSKEKIETARIEITKYKNLESKNITKEQLTEILDKISEILLK